MAADDTRAIVPAEESGRADYDQLVEFRGLEPGEPYFMIRGHDAVGGDTIRAWVMLASAKGAPPALLEQALRQADRLDAWPAKKVADADHLTEAEQLQLVYCLRRRAWNAREDILDLRVFLAEQRAEAEAAARIARMQRALASALEAFSASLVKQAREAVKAAQGRVDAGQRAAAHHQLGYSEGLARAMELAAEQLKGALDG